MKLRALSVAALCAATLPSCDVGPIGMVTGYYQVHQKTKKITLGNETLVALQEEEQGLKAQIADLRRRHEAALARVRAARSGGDSASLAAAEAERDRLKGEIATMEKRTKELNAEIKDLEDAIDTVNTN